jgi:hypothetical protein
MGQYDFHFLGDAQQGLGAPPMQHWEHGKEGQDYDGKFVPIGGSNPDDGHYPLDVDPAIPMSSLQSGTPAQEGDFMNLQCMTDKEGWNIGQSFR